MSGVLGSNHDRKSQKSGHFSALMGVRWRSREGVVQRNGRPKGENEQQTFSIWILSFSGVLRANLKGQRRKTDSPKTPFWTTVSPHDAFSAPLARSELSCELAVHGLSPLDVVFQGWSCWKDLLRLPHCLSSTFVIAHLAEHLRCLEASSLGILIQVLCQKTFRCLWRFYSLLLRGFFVAFPWPFHGPLLSKNSVWAFFVAFSWAKFTRTRPRKIFWLSSLSEFLTCIKNKKPPQARPQNVFVKAFEGI